MSQRISAPKPAAAGTARKIRRAVISVADKTGIVVLARYLAAAGVEIISTGGTGRALIEAGLDVTPAGRVTGMPELLGGRVKTLHPAIHAGLLARRAHPGDRQSLHRAGYAPIDLVCVNPYDLLTVIENGPGRDDIISRIDIGGPAMLRAGAKNYEDVCVVCDPADYQQLIDEMRCLDGATGLAFRRHMAQKAFAITARNDAAMAQWLDKAQEDAQAAAQGGALDGRPEKGPAKGQAGENSVAGPASEASASAGPAGKGAASLDDHIGPRMDALLAPFVTLPARPLAYGENPGQQAWFVPLKEGDAGVVQARILQGKPLSHNNILDADAALQLVSDLSAPPFAATYAIAIIKHTNPCGAAIGEAACPVFQAALAGDRMAAFGGIIAVGATVHAPLASEITGLFTELVIAPHIDRHALEVFAARPALRVLETGGMPVRAPGELALRSISGGFLVQTPDTRRLDPQEIRCVTRTRPDTAMMRDLFFAEKVAAHVKSNAIVIAQNGATVGVGAGQMSRLDAARIAAGKARQNMASCQRPEGSADAAPVAASDAFFPFADALEELAQAGVRAVIQPGGSKRDSEVIAAPDRAGVAMLMTGLRRFRH